MKYKTGSGMWTKISSLAAVLVAAVAFVQAYSTSKQVEVLEQQTTLFEQQTTLSDFAESVKMLESDRTALRIGGIQALSQIAEAQPEEFHIRVMRLLSAYIREADKSDSNQRTLRPDVQAALDAIIYRGARGLQLESEYRLQYSAIEPENPWRKPPPIIDLRGSDLRWAGLYGAELAYAALDGANLSNASGDNANFSNSSLVDATAQNATFISANFDCADMLGGNWSESVLQNSFFVSARMPNEMKETKLEGAIFTSARFGAVDLTHARLREADLSGAKFSTAIRSSTDSITGTHSRTTVFPQLTQFQLDFAIAEESNPPQFPRGLRDWATLEIISWDKVDRGHSWTAFRQNVGEERNSTCGN